MKFRWFLATAMAVLALYVCIMGCATSGKPAQSGSLVQAVPQGEAAPTPADEWRLVREWAGQGITQTEVFDIASNDWKIAWRAYDGSGAGGMFVGGFEIMAYREGASVGDANSIMRGDIVTVAFTQQPGSGEYYLHNGPGRFYLRIAGGMCRWKVTVLAK